MSLMPLVDGIIPFQSDSEAQKYLEQIEHNFQTSTLTDLPRPSTEWYPADSGQASCEVDLIGAIQKLNCISEPQPINAMGRSMAPMPIISSYNVPVPQYGGVGRQRITAAALKNKVLASCRILVKNGTIFNYDGRCYCALDDSRAKLLISAICENELYEHGRFELVTGTLNFILSEPHIQMYEDVLNRRILTFQNGNLDIETGSFRPHTPEVFTTYALLCNYIPNCKEAACPVFDKLLKDISGGDVGIEARIWEMFGYCLSPDIGAKKGFVLQGRKHSGKTLICNLLESLFPQSVISALAVHDFSQRFALSELEGRAICISGDMPAEPLSERVVGHMKKLSGNDLISAEKKYQSNRQFRFGGKLLLVSNHQILISKNDDAFWDRLVAIPFPNTIPPEQQDINLIERLMHEKDVIASKAINAYWRLRERFYRFSGEYPINSGSFLLDFACETIEIKPVVQSFLLQYYESAPYNEGIFMTDAHALFEHLVTPMPLNQFGSCFGNMAIGILGARRGRKRKPGEPNAASYIAGIRLAIKEELL